VRTELGDYRAAFIASGTVCVLAAFLALAVGRGARKAAPGPVAAAVAE